MENDRKKIALARLRRAIHLESARLAPQTSELIEAVKEYIAAMETGK